MAAFNEELDISYETSMMGILNFVKSHSDQKDLFVARFEEMLISNNSPFEVVAFCMRELQWPEIKEFVLSKMNPSQDPRSESLRGVLTAYDEVGQMLICMTTMAWVIVLEQADYFARMKLQMRVELKKDTIIGAGVNSSATWSEGK